MTITTVLPSTFLNVDYYRNLLVDDPKKFWKVVEENDFSKAIVSEMQGLVNEMGRRIKTAKRQDWPQLVAKLAIALGMTDVVANNLDPEVRELSTADERRRMSSAEYVERLELFERYQLYLNQHARNLKDLSNFADYFIEHLLTTIRTAEEAELMALSQNDKLELMAEVCLQMKMHKRLITLIAEEPLFNAGLNFINPSQLQTNLVPVLGLQESTTADNNSNDSNLRN